MATNFRVLSRFLGASCHCCPEAGTGSCWMAFTVGKLVFLRGPRPESASTSPPLILSTLWSEGRAISSEFVLPARQEVKRQNFGTAFDGKTKSENVCRENATECYIHNHYVYAKTIN